MDIACRLFAYCLGERFADWQNLYVLVHRQVFGTVAGGDNTASTFQKIQNLLALELVVHQVLVGYLTAVWHHDHVIMAQSAFVDFVEIEDIYVEGGLIVERQHFTGGLRADAGQRKPSDA